MKIKPWFPAPRLDHPFVIKLTAKHGVEAYVYLCGLLSLCADIGVFDPTPEVVARVCQIKTQKVKRIFNDLKIAFLEALKLTKESSRNLPESSNNLSRSEVQNQLYSGKHENLLYTEQREEINIKKKRDTPLTPLAGGGEFPPGFLKFWSSYPKRQGKKHGKRDCWQHWGNGNLEATTDTILKGLEAWKTTDEWVKEGGKYVPDPIRWLKRRDWEAEIQPWHSNSKRGAQIPAINVPREYYEGKL